MASMTDSLSIYRELADRYDKTGQFSMRDRFLMLAADAALQSGNPAEAERLRARLLQANRHHMLRPYGSFAEALTAPDVQTYLNDLRANYPPDVALQLLDTLRGGGSSGRNPTVEQTQPLDWTAKTPAPPPNHVPQTAPLMDAYGGSTNTAKPSRPAQVPFRVREEVAEDEPPATQQAPPPAPKPLAQPLPSRAVPTQAPPPRAVEPAREIPLKAPPPAPKPKAKPAAPAKAPAQASLHSPHPADEGDAALAGNWLCVALGVLTTLLGIGVLVLALGKPFFPPGTLP